MWADAGGHVLYPLDFTATRKAYLAMMREQDEKSRGAVSDALNNCVENDPYMLDANYPLLEYYLFVVMYIADKEKPFRPLAIPVELCGWLQSLKPEEYLHYRPIDW